MPPPLIVNFADSPWIDPQAPNENPNVCNYCFSNHAMVNVICSRARDQFTMENKPSLEDVWTDRIFDAFTKKHKLATSGARNDNNGTATDLVPQTAEQEERALLIESERQTARNMCHGLFRNSKTAVRACDIPFQGWSSSQIVSLMLEDVVNKDALTIKKSIREAIRQWHPDKFKQKMGHRIVKVEFSEVMGKVTYVAQALNEFGMAK